MGCFQSKTAHLHSPDDPNAIPNPESANGDETEQESQVPTFKEFGLLELKKATNDFSAVQIVFECGEKALNVVYRGKLENNSL